MTILTSSTAAACKAQIRTSFAAGFKRIYTGTSTGSELAAAQNLVRKWFGPGPAESVREVKAAAEIRALVGDFFDDPQRKQVFTIWTFDPAAKHRPEN